MRLLKLLLVLFVCAAAKPVLAGPFEDAMAAYNKRNYATALRLMRQLAEQGVAPAQYKLGSWYSTGLGAPLDYATAVSWLRKAAEQGHAPAQTELGTLYRTGQGVPQDHVTAVSWYRRAADQGDAYAQKYLGTSYRDGKVVPTDYVQAYKWFALAVPSGPVGLGTRERDSVAKKMTPAQVAEGQRLVGEWKPKPER